MISPRTPTAPLELDGPEWEQMLAEHAAHRHPANAHFLQWHGDFIARFNQLPPPNAISAWPAVPEELKRRIGWRRSFLQLENDLDSDIGSFDTLDDLARRIQPLHDYLHNAAAIVYGDPNIAHSDTAPWSPHFWRLHGLIERWYQSALSAGLK